jgi:hypothetical protein
MMRGPRFSPYLLLGLVLACSHALADNWCVVEFTDFDGTVSYKSMTDRQYKQLKRSINTANEKMETAYKDIQYSWKEEQREAKHADRSYRTSPFPLKAPPEQSMRRFSGGDSAAEANTRKAELESQYAAQQEAAVTLNITPPSEDEGKVMSRLMDHLAGNYTPPEFREREEVVRPKDGVRRLGDGKTGLDSGSSHLMSARGRLLGGSIKTFRKPAPAVPRVVVDTSGSDYDPKGQP